MQVEVVVVIPAFKQPRLLMEAALDVLAQKAEFDFAVAIADDACPFSETDAMSRLLATADRRVLLTSRVENGGLSANRNAAVDAALFAFPEVRAVTFLDADDRLDPGTLQHFYNELFDAAEHAQGRRVGWVYTDPYQFGGIHGYLRKPPRYSPLWHLWANSNSATSLIHVDVFRSGCRFDISMRRGSEDWDFWLQAVRCGFVGKFTSPPTFRYRRRPESMTSSAVYHHQNIRAYVKDKNADLYDEGRISLFAEEDASRYCVLWCGEEPSCLVGYFLDALRREARLEQVLAGVANDRYDPLAIHPTILLLAIRDVFESRAVSPHVTDLMMRAEAALAGGQQAVVFSLTPQDTGSEDYGLRIGVSRLSATFKSEADFGEGDFAVLLPTEALVGVTGSEQSPGTRYTLGYLEHTPVDGADRLHMSMRWATRIGEREWAGTRNYFRHVEHWQPEHVNGSSLVPRLLGVSQAPPLRPVATGRAALLLDGHLLRGPGASTFAKLVESLAAAFKVTAILPSRDLDLATSEWLLARAADIVTVDIPEGAGRAEHYLGARFWPTSTTHGESTVNGKLLGYSTLVYAGFPELLASAFSRRRQNVSIIGWWAGKASDRDRGANNAALRPGHRTSDFADHLLAYEHALDLILVPAERDAKYLNARGVPFEKLRIGLASFESTDGEPDPGLS